jgi:peptidoglycan/LPS O-acetylase OafA/YrhL
MFVFFPATLLLIYQKRYKHLGIMVLIATVCLAVYFSSYTPSPIVPPAFSIPNILTGFVLMLGAYVDVQDFHNWSPFTATAVGFIIIGFLIYAG